MATILIVEDEYLVRVGLRTCINWEQHGFIMLEDASDGLTAYHRIVTEHPDIVLLDIKMPRMNGFELLERLKAENIPIQAIILSCCDDFESVRTALHLGVIDYINKLTLNPADLLKILAKIPVSAGSHQSTAPVSSDPTKQIPRPEDVFKALINGYGDNGFLELLYPRGCVACLRLTPDTADMALSPHVSLNMATQILKNNSIENLACCNENGTVCLLFPEQLNSDRIFFALKSNLETTLGGTCTIGFSSAYVGVKNIYEHYRLACQVEYVTFWGKSFEAGLFKQDLIPSPQILEGCRSAKEAIQSHIAAKNTAGALQKLEQFFELFSPGCQVSPNELIKLTLSLLDLFRSDELENSYFQCQNAIVKASCAQEVRKELTAFCLLYFTTRSIHGNFQYSAAITEVIEYMIKHTARFVPLFEAAQHVNMSESYLSQLFKKETGETYIAYSHGYKIELAKTMLTSHMLVYEVCNKIGFENPNYFSKIFKRLTGVSPNEYKNQMQLNGSDNSAIMMSTE